MSNLTIIILHAKHANLLNLAILKLQKQPCFCSCVLKSKKKHGYGVFLMLVCGFAKVENLLITGMKQKLKP